MNLQIEELWNKNKFFQEEYAYLREATAKNGLTNYSELMFDQIVLVDNNKTIDTDLKVSYDDALKLVFTFGGKYRIVTSANGVITLSIQQILGDNVFVFIYETKDIFTKLILSRGQVNQLEEYLVPINNVYSKDEMEFILELDKYTSEIKRDKSYVYTIFYNFISKNNLSIFYEPQYIAHMEELLVSRLSGIGEKTLLNIKKDSSNENIIQIVRDYIRQFLPLMDVLRKHNTLPPKYDEECSDKPFYFVWKLLREIAEDYFSDMFLKSNKGFALVIDPIIEQHSLKDCISMYSSNKEIDIFSHTNVASFGYYLKKRNKGENENWSIIDYINYISKHLLEVKRTRDLLKFEEELLNPTTTPKITISDVDLMSGLEFEAFIARLFKSKGFQVEVTKASGDQGIDVILEKDNAKFGIQAKCFSSAVTNKAIQEVAAGIRHYNLTKGIVVTNNFFTDSAKSLAASNNIILWDRVILKEKLEEAF